MSSETPQTSVASRFVSESSLKSAQEKREAEWKAAYERLGQEPPKREEEEVYDGRSLWEKLQENKNKKQEAFDEQLKFKNQFRALDEEEISFLDSLVDDDNSEEIAKQKEIKRQLEAFKKSVIERQAAPPPPSSLVGSHSLTAQAPIASGSTTVTPAVPVPPKAAAPSGKSKKKDLQKKLLGGVVLKKKAPAGAASPTPPKASPSPAPTSAPVAATSAVKRTAREAEEQDAEGKKRKVDEKA